MADRVLSTLHGLYVNGWNALHARSPGEPGWRVPTPYEEASGVVALVAKERNVARQSALVWILVGVVAVVLAVVLW